MEIHHSGASMVINAPSALELDESLARLLRRSSSHSSCHEDS